jgi:uracil-DNA glycosylase family 4
MDAREQLRRYLEQRRDAGETELVLDGMSVEDVMRLVGAGGAGAAKGASTGSVVPRRPTEVPDSTPPAGHASADWREVLRNSGASPDKTAVTPKAPTTTPAPTPLGEPPQPPKAAAPSTAAAADFAGDSGIPPGGIVIDASTQAYVSMPQLESLDAVAKAVATCTRCPLYSTATNPVPGIGNPNAGLMIVGEAPGANEDEKGEPFVGLAGQLLTKILGAVDLRREDVFIVNVLKHRPPGNRNPMPDEVTACSPYLFRQFELIRPKTILALGTFAAQTLLQTKLGIGKLRNQVHRFHGVPLIVTYHPAALLRNPSWKRPTWEDVQLVRRILDSTIAES